MGSSIASRSHRSTGWEWTSDRTRWNTFHSLASGRKHCDSNSAHPLRTLQGIVGHPILSFAYPFGDLNTRAQRAVRAAGYQLAFTTRPGPLVPTDSRLAEPRIDVHGSQTLNDFARMMQSVR